MTQCFADVIGGQHAQRGAEAEQVGGEPVWVGAADRGDGTGGTVGMVGAEVRRDESHRLIYAAGASSVGEVRIVSVSSSGHQPGAGIPAIADAAYAQRMLGTASEVSLLVNAPEVATPAVLDWSRRAEDAVILAVGDQLRPVLTMPDLLRFLGAGATQGEIDSAMALDRGGPGPVECAVAVSGL